VTASPGSEEGGRHRSRTFERHGDAEAFETDIKRRRQLESLAVSVLQSRVTLTGSSARSDCRATPSPRPQARGSRGRSRRSPWRRSAPAWALDQIVCDLIAYQGLRPGEATAARWEDLGDRTIWVDASKTSKERTVKLLDPVVESLTEWRMASGRPGPEDLILPRTSTWLTSQRRDVDHDEWTLWDWQGRIYRRVAPGHLGCPSVAP
jgi:integrase